MKQIEVNIMGQSYLLSCPEGGEAALQRAVSQVDEEMCAIRDAGKIRARERIAVLAALNLAYQLAQAPRAAAQGSSETPSAMPGDFGDLLQRLDRALAADGNLL